MDPGFGKGHVQHQTESSETKCCRAPDMEISPKVFSWGKSGAQTTRGLTAFRTVHQTTWTPVGSARLGSEVLRKGCHQKRAINNVPRLAPLASCTRKCLFQHSWQVPSDLASFRQEGASVVLPVSGQRTSPIKTAAEPYINGHVGAGQRRFTHLPRCEQFYKYLF